MTRLGIIAGLTVASLAGAFWAGWNYGRASMRADMAEAYQRAQHDKRVIDEEIRNEDRGGILDLITD